MYKKIFSLFTLVLMAGFVSAVSAQTPTETPARQNAAAGEVVSVTEKSIVVQTKDGPIEAILSEATSYKKVPPDNASLKNAVASSFSEIGVGDKVLISGLVSLDKKTMPAKTVYLMTKSDIAQKAAKEVEQWRTRGISGRVVSVNPQAKEITISVSRMGVVTNVVVTAKENAKYQRYPQGSYNYSDAKSSSIAEIHPQDEFRAYGDRSADGVTFSAEGILTGSPTQTTIGVVKFVDTAKNEVVITDDNTKKDITVTIGPSLLLLKKYPAEQAMRFAAMQAGGAAPGGQVMVRPPGAGQPGATPPGAGGPGAGAGGGRAGGINEIVERAPNITLDDLKLGEMIAVVSASIPAGTDRVSAIKLVSGVEPVIMAMKAATAAAPGGQRGGQGGVNGNFTIPGLDGFGGP